MPIYMKVTHYIYEKEYELGIFEDSKVFQQECRRRNICS